jgi:hypothetical protein
MLGGLALTVFRPASGSLLTVCSTAAFFGWIGVKTFPYIALLNLFPVVFLVIAWLLNRRLNSEPGAARE